jgi:ADP-ribose pyrophosphatase YjhB (NUDIX family)
MKRLLFVAIALTYCIGKAGAEPPAGMVLYFESGGDVYLLLAEHARGKRGWAGFGGGARAGETLAGTAAHKGEEESRGYFSRADLLEAIKDQKPVMDGEFAAYFARVAFVPAQRVMNHPVPEDTDAYKERSTFAWIPYSAVESYLQEDIDRSKSYSIDPAYLPAGSQTTWFWSAWLGNMRKAVLADALPWQ